jgi:hypothetical protein
MAKGTVLHYPRTKDKRSSLDAGSPGDTFYDSAFLADRGAITATMRRRKPTSSHQDQRKRA